ncbi:MAG: HigA family addiction module antidote protein [Treponema sp.]|jgi:addiction module HigA family antidote|nr:HigA family addiction module antidote protein [Treponema sp.]
MQKKVAKDPGSVLKSFIDEYQLNPSKLGSAVKLSQSTVRQITLNKMKISVPVAVRLAKFFGNPVDFWIDLQIKYELSEAAKDEKLNAALKEIQQAKKPAPAKKPEPQKAVKKDGAKSARGTKAAAEKAPEAKPAAEGRRRGRKPRSV